MFMACCCQMEKGLELDDHVITPFGKGHVHPFTVPRLITKGVLFCDDNDNGQNARNKKIKPVLQLPNQKISSTRVDYQLPE